MGRKPRITFDGAIYHVIQRGNNRAFIYEDALDKEQFFQILGNSLEKYPFHLLYFTLMDNHYHLLIETKETTLGEIMKDINLCYSKYYNRKHHRTGTLYEGRYGATLVTETSYYLQLIKYIAYNPIRAGLVKHPDDYCHSAHLEVKSQNKGLTSVQRMLSFFHSDLAEARRLYLKLIEDNIPMKITESLNPEQSKIKRLEILDRRLRSIAKDEPSYQLLKTKDRSLDIQTLKATFIKEAVSDGFLIREIAQLLNLTPPAVRNLLKK